MPKRKRPVRNVLTESATRTLMMISLPLGPLAASPAAMEPASTLITATAGESGPPSAGEKVEVSATTTQVITVPIMRPASPREKPPARLPLKMRAAKEIQ